MEIPAAYCFYFPTLLLILLHLIPTIDTRFSTSIATDQKALLAFKNPLIISLDPNNDVLAKNWSSNGGTTTSVCYWIGVSCGRKHQRVTSLNISGFGLKGTLSPHLGNITFLRYLDISLNNFTGLIPYELSRLHRLREIDLGVNSFTGEIPSWFGDLPHLETLGLRNNAFSGKIPPTLFGNKYSCKLQRIDMGYNNLSGSIPEEIGSCLSLRILKLTSNQLMGSIPYAIFNNMCSDHHPLNLKFLSLAKNQLEGRIPPNIWKCRELEILSLSFNNFNGKIPSEIGSLSMLKELYLGFNFFEGGIPSELGRLSRLVNLNLQNSSLTGTVPNQIGNCTSLQELDLSHNNFTGSMPNQIWNCTFLQVLDLSFNNFTGSLPLEWSLFNLEILFLNHNQLSGEIPSSITNSSKLTILELSTNSFSGLIPDFGSLRLLQILLIYDNNLIGAKYPYQELKFLSYLTKCRFLEVVDISGNPLNGILPASLGNLSKSLYELQTDQCNITGVIPYSIGNLTGLRRLAMRYNQFAGSIPPTIGKLNQLQGLYLHANRLQGYIPHDLCRLNRIYELYLGQNVLTGPIPECVGEMDSLGKINLGSNNLNSTIPSNFWNLKYLVMLNLSSNYFSGQLSYQISSLMAINLLDLSHNQFSGDIPSSIDGCQSLEVLYMSNNKFEGFIPPSFGNMRGLTALDLSYNNLSGSIPNTFEGLTSLRQFNVSYNNLDGEIPTGGPFVNFTAQSFFNNSHLCGATKFQVPGCSIKENRTPRRKEVGKLMKYIVPPFILLIFLSTIIILLLIIRKRQILMKVQAPADNISPGATWRRVSYIELVRATNSFSTETNLLGRGSFGSVFKATLSDGFNVAVKVFDSQSERAICSFDTECEILSNIRHRNLVQIVGCCSNTEFKALLLGYMPNGSLEKWLHSDNCYVNLIQRLQIAIDVASALEYLHHGHAFHIVHCDIKPSNVLIDEDMVAHLADFGISKLFEDGETVVHTKTLATIGYAAPEYGSEGKVSMNGDVYSYGILLLEMFTKKKPTNDMFSGELSLREWVYRALHENAVTEVAAPELLLSRENDQSLTANEVECISSIFSLAIKCLAASPDERINMIETVRGLQIIKAKVMTMTTKRRRYD